MAFRVTANLEVLKFRRYSSLEMLVSREGVLARAAISEAVSCLAPIKPSLKDSKLFFLIKSAKAFRGVISLVRAKIKAERPSSDKSVLSEATLKRVFLATNIWPPAALMALRNSVAWETFMPE